MGYKKVKSQGGSSGKLNYTDCPGVPVKEYASTGLSPSVTRIINFTIKQFCLLLWELELSCSFS